MGENVEILRVGILTISDRASSGTYSDKSGPAINNLLNKVVLNNWEEHYFVIPDEQNLIEDKLIDLVDNLKCHLVLTTGGTGPAPRDVTPDATANISDKILDGFGERMRAISLKYVPTAILSRQIGAIRGQTLIINLPGQPKAIDETLIELFEAVPYCIQLVSNFYMETDENHVKAFRPPSAIRQ